MSKTHSILRKSAERTENTLPFPFNANWIWTWHALWYFLLAVSTVIALSVLDRQSWWKVFVLIIALASWYSIILFQRNEHLRHKTFLILGYFAGAIALFILAVMLHPAFFLLLCGLYMQIYCFLRFRWSTVVSTILTLLTLWLNYLLSGEGTIPIWSIIVTLVSLVFGFVLALFIESLIHQSSHQQELIIELKNTQEELVASERRAGILTERQRLAREIHDTLAQGFISMIMHLEAADQKLPVEYSQVRWHIEQARQTGRDSLTEARQLVWDLRSEILTRTSLEEVLERTTRRWSEECIIPCTFSTSGCTQHIHPEVEVTLLRILQEALANIRKHAQARQVRCSLSILEDEITLDIYDDGIGFPTNHLEQRPPSSDGSGLGLQTMNERVNLLGGLCAIESTPGAGTTIGVILPLLRRTQAVDKGDA